MLSAAKEAAGRAAVHVVQSGMTLGLGTGSTLAFALKALGERIRHEGLDVRGVPTSLRTEHAARELGIPLIGLDEVNSLDLAIDGADEVDPHRRLVKGGGGALLREKVIASLARRVIIVVDPGKCVDRLGDAFPLPIEVVDFARPVVERMLVRLGGEPTLRRTPDGDPYRTDNGHPILDCRFPGGIDDPKTLEQTLSHQPGLVESGLFIDLCHDVIVGHSDGRAEWR